MPRRNNSFSRFFVSVAVKAVVVSISSVEKAAAGVQQPFISFVTAAQHHRLIRGFVSTTTPGTTTARNNNKNNNNNNFQRRMRSEIPSVLLPPPRGFDEVVVEGKGKVLQRENEVFYNRPQVVNRGLIAAVIREFQREGKKNTKTTRLRKRDEGKGCITKYRERARSSRIW